MTYSQAVRFSHTCLLVTRIWHVVFCHMSSCRMLCSDLFLRVTARRQQPSRKLLFGHHNSVPTMRSCSVRSTHTPAAARGLGRLAMGPMPSMKPCRTTQQQAILYQLIYPAKTQQRPSRVPRPEPKPQNQHGQGVAMGACPCRHAQLIASPEHQSAQGDPRPLDTPGQSPGRWRHLGCLPPVPWGGRCSAARSCTGARVFAGERW